MKSLRMKWIWIASLVVGLGCGDDESAPANQVNANVASSNNATNADENTGNTNQGSENNLNVGETNNQKNASTNNTSTNNTLTNNTANNATNNTTNNQPMGISCMEILQCLLVCTTGDEECQAECSSQGTEDAQKEIDAFLGCVDMYCEDAMTVTTLTECTLEYCSEEQNTCLGM